MTSVGKLDKNIPVKFSELTGSFDWDVYIEFVCRFFIGFEKIFRYNIVVIVYLLRRFK